MAYKVILGRRAMCDLEEIRDFIAKDNPEAAVSFCESLLDRTEGLATFPERGGRIQQRSGIRFVVHGPYLILYRIDEKTSAVRVSRFWHGARNRARLEDIPEE